MKKGDYYLTCPYYLNGQKNTEGMEICDRAMQQAQDVGATNSHLSMAIVMEDYPRGSRYGIKIEQVL